MVWVIYNLIWVMECIVILMCIHMVNGESICCNRKSLAIIVINNVLYSVFTMGLIPKMCADVLIMFILVVYSFCVFRKSIGKTIITYLLGMLLAAFIEIGAVFISSFLNRLINVSETAALVSGCSALVIAWFVNVFYLKIAKKAYYSTKDIGILSADFVCIVLMCWIVADFVIYNRMNRIFTFLALVLVLLVYGLLSVLKKRRWELESKNREMEMYRIYDGNYKELVKEVRRKQHDYKNQLTTILGMKQRPDGSDELKKQHKQYANELEEKFKYEHLLTYCNNSILAGFLYYKCLNFEKTGINVDFEINVDKAKCEMYLHEIVEVLGILLDNAYEYLRKHKQFASCVLLRIWENEKQFLIEVKNQALFLKNKEIDEMFQEGYSTKGNDRGIGLFRVKQLTDKYGAELIVGNKEIQNNNWLSFQIVVKK